MWVLSRGMHRQITCFTCNSFQSSLHMILACGKRDGEQESNFAAPHPFGMDIDVEVIFLRNGTPMASIIFEVSHCEQQ